MALALLIDASPHRFASKDGIETVVRKGKNCPRDITERKEAKARHDKRRFAREKKKKAETRILRPCMEEPRVSNFKNLP